MANKDPLDIVQQFIDKNKDSFGQIGFGGGALYAFVTLKLRTIMVYLFSGLLLTVDLFLLGFSLFRIIVLLFTSFGNFRSHGILLRNGFPQSWKVLRFSDRCW